MIGENTKAPPGIQAGTAIFHMEGYLFEKRKLFCIGKQ